MKVTAEQIKAVVLDLAASVTPVNVKADLLSGANEAIPFADWNGFDASLVPRRVQIFARGEWQQRDDVALVTHGTDGNENVTPFLSWDDFAEQWLTKMLATGVEFHDAFKDGLELHSLQNEIDDELTDLED